MRLTFQLRFHTHFGQSILLTGNHELLGDSDIAKAIPLEYLNEQFWKVTIVLDRGSAPESDIVYNYVLLNADGSLVYDWGRDKVINPARIASEELLIIDSWNHAGYYENAFYTEPFQQVLLKGNHTEVAASAPAIVTHTFKVKAPLLEKGQTLCLLGEGAGLGSWDTRNPILLSRSRDEDFFKAQLNLGRERFPISYKYGVYEVKRGAFVGWENGGNRILDDQVGHTKQTIINDGFALLPSTTWRGTGVAIPVFSLRSEASFGVGEFTDLKLLADWCKQTGLKLIQILPVNDTIATYSRMDSYPYAAISAFALHPLYLNLKRVAEGDNLRLLEDLEPERKRLNGLDAVDYEAVINAKLGFLRKIYLSQKATTFRRKDYRSFLEGNKHWLFPYAAFCCLRDKYATADFNAWPEHQHYAKEEIERLIERPGVGQDVGFYLFVQFHLHAQLEEAKEYAHAQGVILKGDLPIGVARGSADAWQQPELFHLDVQAGAPPDAFTVKGQNWGFPTYNWGRMKETGFTWWKHRFEQMSRYFDAFRVDHILGFFRIWSIPANAIEGILGYFVPVLPVHIDEFAQRGVRFDRDRFVKPYITEKVLLGLFGKNLEEVKEYFLDTPSRVNRTDETLLHSRQSLVIESFVLKPEFATQRQAEEYFAGQQQNEQNQRLKEGLFDLITNVILFEPPGSDGTEFHFRFAMETSSSFQDLDAGTQAQLRELFIDYFFRRQDAFWMKEAMEKLPALKRATNLLVCGEDLGLVPACVPEVMKQLGLLSLEIQRMPKEPGREFFHPKDAPYLSVVTPSSHDMSTIRGWWEEDRNVTQRFYNQELGQPGEAPPRCEPWINQAIVMQHLSSPAMWSIFQLQDIFGIDGEIRRENPAEERINVPGNPKNYWHYRMHLTLEALLQARRFNEELRRLIQRAGR